MLKNFRSIYERKCCKQIKSRSESLRTLNIHEPGEEREEEDMNDIYDEKDNTYNTMPTASKPFPQIS